MATVSNDERDNRPRLIYKPYAGKKGPEFEPWVVGFLDAAEVDSFSYTFRVYLIILEL